METGEAEIAAKKLRERGKRLWKNYRWTNEMYDALLAEQGGVCAACGQPPKDGGMKLVVDHYHFKVRARRSLGPFNGAVGGGIASLKQGWEASCPELSNWNWWGKTKEDAIRLAKDSLLPLSVRGLLCPGRHGKAGHGSCNRLIGRIDNIEWLRKVIHYLENPPAKKILDKTAADVVRL